MRNIVVLAVVVAVAAPGCGKKKEAPGGGASKPAADVPALPTSAPPPGGSTAAGPSATAASKGGGDLGSCEVEVSGDVQAKGSSPGGPRAMGTDYWMTEEELKAAASQLAALSKDADKAAAAKKIMSQDPRLVLAIVNCSSDKVRLHFAPSGKSTYADVPFAPKKYVLSSGRQPGQWEPMLSVDGKSFHLSADGTFDVTRFDKTGFTATFEFEAVSMAKPEQHVKVTGKVDYACGLGTKVCEEGRGGK
jgi:hypothetical protein